MTFYDAFFRAVGAPEWHGQRWGTCRQHWRGLNKSGGSAVPIGH